MRIDMQIKQATSGERAYMNKTANSISEREKDAAEEEIVAKERIVDYDTKEYTVELIVKKYLDGLLDEENEIYVPDYQREFTWLEERKSKFIESVLIGLPIPYIFVADIGDKNGRLEIVDGAQRIRTLAAFTRDEITLVGLKKLGKLNGFRFSDLPLSRQRRFHRRSLRMVELTQKADEEVRRDIFERINTGSDVLKDMEIRRGISDGPLVELLEECGQIPLFKQLAPISPSLEKRREREEFVLRFFAYLENYQQFERYVNKFLDEYLDEAQSKLNKDQEHSMKTEFTKMLEFVSKHFPNGFAKGSKHTKTPRIRYEAIAVGSALALRADPQCAPASMGWLESDKFKALTTSDSSNSKPKVIERIEYVRDNLLGVYSK